MENLNLSPKDYSQKISGLYFTLPIAESDKYLVKIAETEDELKEVHKLRFRVFNLEMNVGLDSAYKNQLDRDIFDSFALQLIVKNKENNKVVATYRVQNYEITKNGRHICGSDRYDLSKMPREIVKNSLVVSRACIDKNHRSSKVFFLLWQGLAILLYENNLRYFFGSSSIPCNNPQDANSYVALLETMDAYHGEILIKPHEDNRCIYRKMPVDITKTILPSLFNLYIRFNCRVCSEPCMHKAFKTLDFLIIYDAKTISDKQHKMFLGTRVRIY